MTYRAGCQGHKRRTGRKPRRFTYTALWLTINGTIYFYPKGFGLGWLPRP